MKLNPFLKTAALCGVLLMLAVSTAMSKSKSKPQTKEIYEFRIYTVSADAAPLDKFFSETLIPAYNRQGVKAGAFTLYKKEDAELRYLMLVYPDIETFQKVKQDIWKDKKFIGAAQPFYDMSAKNPVYTKFESYLCEAFDKIPVMLTPDKERGLFELRIYHSPNEEANQRKVKMFNDDEIAVFDEVGINSVCYGETLAGPWLPSLVYLTWYKDEPARNQAWKAFGENPEWKRISKLPEYANTATKSINRLLLPMPYSQF